MSDANNAFCQMMRSSGLAEPWTHAHEDSKFDQFGWRCTTKESGYGISTLVGNYNEDRFDLKHRLQTKPLPSQYNHYFNTTYDTDFNKQQQPMHRDAKGLKRYHPRSFPGHQPEIDSDSAKAVYNDWNTASTAAYKPYNLAPACNSQQKPAEQTAASTQQTEWNVSMETTPIVHLGARVGHSAPGGHIISPPHSGPGTGKGSQAKSYKTTVGY